MADNTQLDAGSGGDLIASDDISGVKYPRSKIVIGADGTNDGDVSSANPLPISGTVDLGATDNAVLDSIVTNTASGAVVGGGAEATALRVTIANDSTGVLSIDDGGSAITVDGTVTANLGVVDNAVLDNIAASAAIIDDAVHAEDAAFQNGDSGFAAMAVRSDIAASTAANGDYQPLITNGAGALWVAGTVSVSGLTQDEDSAHQSGDAGVMALGVRQDTQSDFGADGDYVPLSINADGELRVTSAGGSGGTSDTDDSSFTAGSDSGTPIMGFASSDTVDSGDVGVLAMDTNRRLLTSLEVDNVGLALESGGNLADIETNTDFGATTGGGTESGALRVTIANDSTGVLSIDDNGGSITIDGTVDLGATDNAVLDQIVTNTTGLAGTVSGSELQVDVVASLPAGTNLIGQVAASASTSATGSSTFYDADLDETKVEVTDNATVRIYSITAFNTTDAPLFLQLFDLDADNVTVGSTTPTNQYVIPGNANSDGAGFSVNFPVPKSYSTGFTVACTTNSEGSSAPGAGACICNIEYVSA